MTEKPVKYRVTDLKGEDWDRNERRIKLPSMISEMDLSSGDTVYLEKKGNGATHIHGEKATEKGKTTEGYYKIYRGNWLILAARWNDLFTKPLYQAALEFHLEDEPSFRIYDLADFALHRLPELKNQGKDLEQIGPAAAATVWELLRNQEDYVDIASLTPYNGQKFRVVPFNADHRIFPSKPSDKEITPGVINKLVQNEQLPRCTAEKITVTWSQNNTDQGRKIYQKQKTTEARLKLPEKGFFSIHWENTTSTGKVGGRTELSYNKFRSNWQTKYCMDGEKTGEITVFMPYRAR